MPRLLPLAVVGSLPVLCLSVPQRAIVGNAPVSPRALALDEETVLAARHLCRGYPARNPDGSINAVVEIPSGTIAKFAVDEESGRLRWERDRVTGGRREIDYLAYPVNYGMVPQTLSDDGDPIDVLLLGRGVERGHVARTRIIGVLKMAHDGTRDDKLLAVPREPDLANGFSRLSDIDQLDEQYPASRQILFLWFSNYWGAGATEVVGWGDAAEAHAILEAAMAPVTVCSGRPAAGGRRPRGTRPSGVPAG